MTTFTLVLAVHFRDQPVDGQSPDDPRQDLLMQAEAFLQLGEGHRFFGRAEREANGCFSLRKLDAILTIAAILAAAAIDHGC